MAEITPQQYCSLASVSGDSDHGPDARHGYAALPGQLLSAERDVLSQYPALVPALNKALCQFLLEQFNMGAARWSWTEQFGSLYERQLERINRQLDHEHDNYFSLSHDPFRKDLAILRHRLIPFGAELATPFSGIARSLIIRDGWRQAIRFVRVMVACGGSSPFLELHMHPRDTSTFSPEGWIETYENLADFLEANPSLRGVQSSSWFLDPAIDQVSPHLSYLRQVPEYCGATILYSGDEGKDSGALATSKTRRELYQAELYRPRCFTRIWPRQKILQRLWRTIP